MAKVSRERRIPRVLATVIEMLPLVLSRPELASVIPKDTLPIFQPGKVPYFSCTGLHSEEHILICMLQTQNNDLTNTHCTKTTNVK